MVKRKKTAFIFFINALLFSIVLLFHYSGASVKILGASPMSALALLVALIMFTSELTGVIVGLAIGVFLDSVAMTPSGFNTVTFAVIALLASLISHYLFNRNLKSALTLCLICAASYFFLRWLAVFALNADIVDSLDYLIKIAAPSAVYTAIFIVPFFYIEKRLFSEK